MNCRRFFSVVAFLVWAAFALAACRSETSSTRPLIDADHYPSVLVEEALLSHPRSVDHNRLLRGWRFVRHGDRRLLAPNGPESVVEIVTLDQRPRVLTIDAGDVTAGGVVVTVRGRELGRFPIADGLEIALPGTLPVGRIELQLEFSDAERLRIGRLRVAPVHRAGDAVIGGDAIVQTGWSLVELTRMVEAGDNLVVGFRPPSSARPDQRFAITVEDATGGLRTPFCWRASTADDDAAPAVIDIPLTRHTGPVKIGFLAAGAGPAGHWLAPRIVGIEPPAVSERPTVVPAPPRLIVLYVMDALRADHVGHLGAHELTPNLDRLAAAGASFSGHFAVAPNTAPSMRALFSGLCLLDDRRLPHPGPVRLAETFRRAGYRTASFTANPHLGPTLDLAPGFDTVELMPIVEDHHPERPATINDSAERLNRAALAWIDGLGRDERAFVVIHTMNPHNPYTPPEPYVDRFIEPGPSTIDGRTRTLVAIRDRRLEPGADDIRRLRRLYAAGVAYNDAELGRFVDALGRRVESASTLLVATSDHGEELFEHDGVLHGYTLYDEMLHIPLILHWPGTMSPTRLDGLSNTLDLYVSLAELVGGTTNPSTGRSLWPRVIGSASATAQRRLTFAAAPGLEGAIMVRSDRWKLIHAPRDGFRRGLGHGRGRSRDLEYLFDLERDPAEAANLAGVADLEIAWMRTRLLGWLATQRQRQPERHEQTMDAETKTQLEALGYIVDD